MDKIRNHIHFLKYLSLATAQQRKQLLSSVSTEQVNFITEITYNLLQGNIKLKESDYLCLSKFKSTFRKLVSRDADISYKRELLFNHSNAVFVLYNILDSDTEASDTEEISSSESSESDCESSFTKDDGPERCPKVNIITTDPISAAFTSSVKNELPTSYSQDSRRPAANQSLLRE